MSHFKRGGPRVAATAAVIVVTMAMVFNCDVAEAATRVPTTYYVGDIIGNWTPDVRVAHWPHHKTFYVGDKLVFKYDKLLWNVAEVTKYVYKKCIPSPSATTYQSGEDVITLDHPGHYYYICTSTSSCCEEGGMKIHVYANP